MPAERRISGRMNQHLARPRQKQGAAPPHLDRCAGAFATCDIRSRAVRHRHRKGGEWKTVNATVLARHVSVFAGLLTGLVEANFQNPRMGLAAHLEGVMNGAFLVALVRSGSGLKLSSRQQAAAYWTVLYGTYANWATTTLAAILGTLRCHRSRRRPQCPTMAGNPRHVGLRVGRARDHRGVDHRALGSAADSKADDISAAVFTAAPSGRRATDRVERRQRQRPVHANRRRE